jgi:GAF domain-containing protein
MTDIDRYREGARHCAKMSSGAVNQELQSIWVTVERSYRFLLEREERIAREASSVWLPRERLEEAENRSSLADLLDVLVSTAVEHSDGKARAAFYLADPNQTELRHIIGMPQAYAHYVDGFAIGPQSLACGLAAATRRPVITPDVAKEPRWKQWLWLAEQFGYRACWSFPVSASSGEIVGTFAVYYEEPREATPRDFDLAALLTRTAAGIISRR